MTKKRTEYAHRWLTLTDSGDCMTCAMPVPGGVLVRTIVWGPSSPAGQEAEPDHSVALVLVPEVVLMRSPYTPVQIEADPDEGIEAREDQVRTVELVAAGLHKQRLEDGWEQLK